MMSPVMMMKQAFMILMTLLTILMIPSLFSFIRCYISDHGQNPLSMNLSIMTFNIEVFNSAGSNEINSNDADERVLRIIDRIVEHQPDFVLLQEDLYPSPLQRIAGYRLLGSCIAETLTWPRIVKLFPMSKNLSNSIWAKESFIAQYHLSSPTITHLNMSQNCPDPRCSVVANFGIFSIANVHLCGGKFTDELFLNNTANDVIYSKDESLLHLIEQSNPTFIGGDFNGERDRNIMHGLGNYGLLNELSHSSRADFIKFFQSGHAILDKHGYTPFYKEADVESTSKFGPVVDWIYFKESDGIQLKQKQVHKVYACDISDHDAVLVNMTIAINKCLV